MFWLFLVDGFLRLVFFNHQHSTSLFGPKKRIDDSVAHEFQFPVASISIHIFSFLLVKSSCLPFCFSYIICKIISFTEHIPSHSIFWRVTFKVCDMSRPLIFSNIASWFESPMNSGSFLSFMMTSRRDITVKPMKLGQNSGGIPIIQLWFQLWIRVSESILFSHNPLNILKEKHDVPVKSICSQRLHCIIFIQNLQKNLENPPSPYWHFA